MWSIVANAAICSVEYMNRTGGFGSFWQAIPYTFLPIALAQIGLFYAWKDAPKMLIAWIVFTIGNSLFRIASTWLFVGEPLNLTVLAGVLLMIAGGRVVAMGYGS